MNLPKSNDAFYRVRNKKESLAYLKARYEQLKLEGKEQCTEAKFIQQVLIRNKDHRPDNHPKERLMQA